MLRKAAREQLAGRSHLNIVDVGCGHKPFYPFFAPYAGSYIGTDVADFSGVVDRICPAEKLDVDSEWADLTLCLSVLEHVDDPGKAVQELRRVTKQGGIVFSSTHGCFPWHPYPQDHWRWTQTGLGLLFTRTGGFAEVHVEATHGSIAHIFFLLAHYISLWCQWKPYRRWLRNPSVQIVNRLGERLDKRYPSLADVRQEVTAIPEFFVIAR
jgi:SAM-dependent methyltransferase